jgi:hypothetical protein
MTVTAPDFSGYATKAGLKCTDGRTITSKAFEHQDGDWVPLVWQHGHDKPDNLLGKARLEHRDDGTYCYAYFNGTRNGQDAKLAVQHGDIVSLSIYANKLVEKSKEVLHGMIREVSLVLSGANPGAKIDFVAIQHSDGELETLEDEAVIFTGLTLVHSEEAPVPDPTEDSTGAAEETKEAEAEAETEAEAEAEAETETVEDVYEDMSVDQKMVTHYMISHALKSAGHDIDPLVHADTAGSGETVQAVFDAMSDKQKQVVYYMIGAALDSKQSEAAQHSDDATGADVITAETATPTEDTLTHQEGSTMTNVFDQSDDAAGPKRRVLSHSELTNILVAAKESGSFKKAVLAHADSLQHADPVAGVDYGITNLDMLFPDAKALMNSPEFISRRMEWVSVVLNGTKHSPFAKVKSFFADITADEARAKGYVKGTRKVEEVFSLLQRTTGPATIYKKQKLDRDDILDITDMDVVMFLKGEMRLMIEEEVARAILVGDNRSAMSPDKVKDPAGSTDGTGIRSILHDDDLYVIRRELAANVSPRDAVKGLVRSRSKYRGSGKPTLFISDAELTDIMLEEDKFGRALYETEQALADKLRVKEIVTVDLFDEYDNLFAIMVSLQDYTIGTNKGGELTSFEDFDIDFNQEKYLQETRLSGGLTKPFSAIVVTRGVGTLATATQPSFDGTTNTITIPTSTGVVYTINDEPVTGDIVITSVTTVEAAPDNGYYLESNTTRDWTYTP